MKFAPLDTKEQGNCSIDKVIIVFGNDNCIIEYITNFDIDYNKLLESNISISFHGINPQLIEMQHSKQRIQYMKFVGRFTPLKYYQEDKGSITQSFILNIPCDMQIDNFEMSGDFDDPCPESTIAFIGDMW